MEFEGLGFRDLGVLGSRFCVKGLGFGFRNLGLGLWQLRRKFWFRVQGYNVVGEESCMTKVFPQGALGSRGYFSK